MTDLIPAPRPVESPEDRMRHATANPGRSFRTWMSDTDREQLDARAATAEQERDDALDDRDQARRERDDYAKSRNHFADLLQATATALDMLPGDRIDNAPAAASRLRAERDEALEARDVLRHRERLLLDVMRRVVEDLHRTLAHYETQPQQAQESRLGSPAARAQDELA